MAYDAVLKRRAFGQTERRDTWWLQPIVVFLGFGAFIAYSTWAAFQGDHYHVGNYLSPMYSPEIFGASPHAWFGARPGFWPGWLPFSPAFLVLWAPAGFRLSCYYYRGSLYKAYWGDPPACAVGEPRKSYRGENSLPLIIQNIHRYFLYGALLLIVSLSWDAIKSYQFEDGLGIGIGSLVLTLNAVLLAGFTFGCHALRHLVGGGLKSFAKNPLRFKCWTCVSGFNRKHMVWAWSSLAWVGFSDVYVRLVSMGIWTDLRIL